MSEEIACAEELRRETTQLPQGVRQVLKHTAPSSSGRHHPGAPEMYGSAEENSGKRQEN
ncbi:hypothetical protein P7K49_026463 [Saguinus oedipus]|uniref:Uncharacterized protein n=1 Tax=Saguinus oedipus TaxID=9490 RepID=A0ABQ9UFH5_SAGOE|nr:hypothetical protein P7K49_026463 [Saguinus oedipus]